MEDLVCIGRKVVKENAATTENIASLATSQSADRDHLADHAVVLVDTRHHIHLVDETDPVKDVKTFPF